MGARLVFATRTEFILVGLLLGDSYLGVMDHATLEALEPMVLMCVAWVGMLFGLQFERRSLATLPRSFFAASIVQALVTLVVVFGTFLLVLSHVFDVGWDELVLGTATLAAAAACTGQPGLAFLQRRTTSTTRPLITLLRTVAGLDPLVGILAFGLVVSVVLGAAGGGGAMAAVHHLALALVVGGLMGGVLMCLCQGKVTAPELVLMLLGTVAICGGLASQLGVSALFLGTVCGIATANLSPHRARMVELMVSGETLLYVVLLVLAGASWVVPSPWLLGLGALYLVVRLLGKLVGFYAGTRHLARHVAIPSLAGLALTAQAGMALAIVIDYHEGMGALLRDEILSIVVLGVLASELIGPALAGAIVRRVRPGDEVAR